MWQERGVDKTEMIAALYRKMALHQRWHALTCYLRSRRLCQISFQTPCFLFCF